KNGTSKDTVTLFTGATDIGRYGLIDKFNGQSNLSYYTSEKCNSLMGSDGSIFPPHLTKNSTIHVYDKDLCRILPLVYEKNVMGSDDIPAYRFSPPLDVFEDVDKKPENLCFCPHGPPCAPSGFFNMTNLMGLATKVPPIARAALTGILFVVGVLLLLVAVWRLVRGANRLSSLHLAPGHVGPPANKNKDVPMGNVPRN
ncbi:CD36 domain containing protein, partial [Asbolus verrucosus]